MRGRSRGKTLVASDEGDDANGVLIKLYGEETNGAISIIEQPFEPGLLLPPHLHQNDVWLSILEGAMPARVGDEVVTATPGCWVLKPRRIPHTMWNAGPEPARISSCTRWVGSSASSRTSATGAPRAGRARRAESPWRAARYQVLRRLDSGPERRL
jgi:quercetin dioxygenase-like cupin family protein